MSKLGRYSSDRKKIKAVTASRDVEVSECGSVFTVDSSGGGVDLTLPTAAGAGAGWWIKVFVIDSTNDVKVLTSGSENVMLGYAANSADDDEKLTVTALSDGDTITIGSAALSGVAEVISDGTRWLVEVFGSHGTADDKVKLTKAS